MAAGPPCAMNNIYQSPLQDIGIQSAINQNQPSDRMAQVPAL